MQFIDLTGKGEESSNALAEFAKGAMLHFESSIFNKADETIEDYNGGQWSVGTIDGQYIMFIDSDEKVTAKTAFNTISTDLRTASFAVYYIMVNLWCHHFHENEELCRHYADAWYKLRDIAFNDENVLNLDRTAFYSITD